MGSDLGRGLLEFGYGRVLGERGFWWLQIHLANLAGNTICSRLVFIDIVDPIDLLGMDKASHVERLAYVKNNLNLFFDCAMRPLAGSVHSHM